MGVLQLYAASYGSTQLGQPDAGENNSPAEFISKGWSAIEILAAYIRMQYIPPDIPFFYNG